MVYTDSPLVTSAPTGSGKTVIFELAIIRLLMQTREQMAASKVVYGKNRRASMIVQTNMDGGLHIHSRLC